VETKNCFKSLLKLAGNPSCINQLFPAVHLPIVEVNFPLQNINRKLLTFKAEA
jgi:hypothetical protein